MSVVWYWAEGGRREGPLDWAALREAAREGTFTPEAWIWTPGYGKAWRKASTIAENLFPKKEEPAAAQAPDAATPAFGGDAAAAGRRPLPLAERSPFTPRVGETGSPRKVVATRSLLIALANMRVVLFRPFSFVRYLLFSIPVLMAWVGFSTGGPAFPLAPVPEAQSARLRSLGLDAVAAPFAEFFEKRSGDLAAPFAMANPESFAPDLATAMQRSSSALVAWFGRPGGLALSIAGLLAVFAFCAVSSWFFARAWALLFERVYRRDESASSAWLASARPAATLFRGLFALRAAFLVVEVMVFACAVHFFASLPEGTATGRHAMTCVLAIAAIEMAGSVASGIVRDFALPLVSLRGMAFRPALSAALRSLGWWFLRYLAISAPFMAAAQALSALLVLAVFGIVGVGGGSALFSLAFSLAAAPWFLVHRLWSLDICFDLDPSLRTEVPALPPLPRGPDFPDGASGHAAGPDGEHEG